MPTFDKPTTPPPKEPSYNEVSRYSNETQGFDAITSMDGTPYVVLFYQQILREDDSPKTLDPVLDPAEQQYRKINHAEILLQGALNYTYDASNGITEITGDVLIYPSMVVNSGDHFIMDIEDGSRGLFALRNVTPVTYLSKSSYRAEIYLFRILDQTWEDSLEVKTTEVLYFHASTKQLDKVPYVDATRSVDIGKLVRLYFDEFYDYRTGTFLVPGFEYTTYDPFIVEFWNKVIPAKLMGRSPRVTEYKYSETLSRKSFKTVFDLVLNRVDYPKANIVKQVTVESGQAFRSVGTYYNISNGLITDILWPVDYADVIDSDAEYDEEGDHYVFSKSFYTGNSEEYSDAEDLVSRYISGEDILFTDLVDPVNNLVNAEPIRRFYEFPIYVVLALSSS